jgi:membrane protease YdiL (CAAX protease family)
MNAVLMVRKHPLVSFFILACLFGWSPYLITFLRGGSGAENFPLGPVIATLIVVCCQGRQELRAWGRRLRSWGATPRWYLLALLAPIALQVLIVLVNHGFGAPLPTGDQLADWPQVPVTFVAMLVFVGIGEEAGWIAFAAPILLRRHGLVLAWVLASTMRILWHLPLMVTGELSWSLGVVGNAAFTMAMLLVFTASDGRWTLVAVWHAALNATGGLFFFKMVSGADQDRLDYLLCAAYAVVATAGYVTWVARGRSSSAAATPNRAAGAVLRRATTGGSHEN